MKTLKKKLFVLSMISLFSITTFATGGDGDSNSGAEKDEPDTEQRCTCWWHFWH